MLGHQLWRRFQTAHDVWVTLRRPVASYAAYGLFDADRTISGVDAASVDDLAAAVRKVRPDAVINCIGVIKQLEAARDPLTSLTINSLLPHRLAALCKPVGARLVHISTDCVFSGRRGAYSEEDIPDAEDLYGRTKYLGEVQEPHCITLRTSIIGRELETRSGLIEWFLSQEGHTITGYRRAIYSGLTTPVLARVIDDVLLRHPDMSGLWHVSSDPINKYDLLCLARTAFGWDGEIVPDDEFVCDRSLVSTRFRLSTAFVPPSWPAMLSELARAPS